MKVRPVPMDLQSRETGAKFLDAGSRRLSRSLKWICRKGLKQYLSVPYQHRVRCKVEPWLCFPNDVGHFAADFLALHLEGAEESFGGAVKQFGEEATDLCTTTIGGLVRDQHGLVHVVRHDRLHTLAGCLKVLEQNGFCWVLHIDSTQLTVGWNSKESRSTTRCLASATAQRTAATDSRKARCAGILFDSKKGNQVHGRPRKLEELNNAPLRPFAPTGLIVLPVPSPRLTRRRPRLLVPPVLPMLDPAA